MTTPIETPDRRPLLYGVFALVILIAAAYLFWPRSPQQDSLVLTPESVRNQAAAADATGPIDPMAEVNDEAANAAVEPATEQIAAGNGPAKETRIIETETPAKVTQTAIPTPEPEKQTKPAPRSSLEPSSTGNWVLNVGAFSTRANAQRRAQELSQQGLAAHVHDVTQGAGKVVYRVRVGYFNSNSKAKSYGEWLQRNHGISSWPSER